MPINVTCSTCNATLRAPDTAAGKQIKCPKCQAVLLVPQGSVPPMEVTGAPPLPTASAAPAPPSSRRDDDDRPSRRRDRDRNDDYDDRPRRRWRRSEEVGDTASSSSNGVSIGLGIGAIALGLIAAIFAFIPCCGALVAWPAGGIGLLLGLIGVLVCMLARQKSVAAMILTISGSLVNVAAIAISIVWWIWFAAVANETHRNANDMVKEVQRLQQDAEKQKQLNQGLNAANAVEKQKTLNNFKQIGLAFHNYHAAYGTLPPAQGAAMPNGKGKHSWRVLILPFLEQKALYDKFKLDEDWSSPHNINARNTNPMPEVYKAARPKFGEDRRTYVQLFTGQKTIYTSTNAKPKLTQITDGTGNTLLAAEAIFPVDWTQPQDIEVVAGFFNATSSLGGVYDGDFHALAADGRAFYLRKNQFSDAAVRQLIDPMDGMVVQGWPPPKN